MQLHELEAWRVIEKVAGKTVARMQRVWWVKNGLVSSDEGELQIEFEQGEILLMKHSSNGDIPAVTEERWIDPFTGQIDEATQRWIQDVGKADLVDVSDRPPYRAFIHQPIAKVLPLFYHLGEVSWLCGARFVSREQQVLDFYYIGDECHVGDGEKLPQNIHFESIKD